MIDLASNRRVFGEELQLFRESTRRFLKDHATPYRKEWSEKGVVDRVVWDKAGAQGLLCPSVPEEYGGLGLDFRYHTVVTEEMVAAEADGPGFSVHSDIVTPYLMRHGSEQQKQKYLPECVSGNLITAIAMTEPAAGSDLKGINSRLTQAEGGHVLNGSKTFISNGQLADLIVVVCKNKHDQRLSLVLVERGMEGFSRGKNLDKLGLKAQDTSELFFDNVFIPDSNILGELGNGLQYLTGELPQERLSIALSNSAAARCAIANTVEYVQSRRAFGSAVADFQNTQFVLAELDAEVSAMQVFIDDCIERHLQCELSALTAAKAKLLASELNCKVVDRCVQLHGGYGFMLEYPITRAYANARIQPIHGGTSEIMKHIIARELFSPSHG